MKSIMPVGTLVRLTKKIKTKARVWPKGSELEVYHRDDGDFSLVIPGEELSGPAAVFGHLFGISRNDIEPVKRTKK